MVNVTQPFSKPYAVFSVCVKCFLFFGKVQQQHFYGNHILHTSQQGMLEGTES